MANLPVTKEQQKAFAKYNPSCDMDQFAPLVLIPMVKHAFFAGWDAAQRAAEEENCVCREDLAAKCIKLDNDLHACEDKLYAAHRKIATLNLTIDEQRNIIKSLEGPKPDNAESKTHYGHPIDPCDPYVWRCWRCGTTNGINTAVCRACEKKEGET